MIKESTMRFLQDLAENNNKPWFDENRLRYDDAKEDVIRQVNDIIKMLSAVDSGYEVLTARDCLFRINRDVRFSNDKRPYKTNIGAYINKGGKKSGTPGYYLHIEPGKSFAAAGVWMPEKDALASIRQEIDYNFPAFKKILATASFKSTFPEGFSSNEKLQRPPKNYDESNPAIEYIKQKSFVVTTPLTDKELTSATFNKKIEKIFKAAAPLNAFLEPAFH